MFSKKIKINANAHHLPGYHLLTAKYYKEYLCYLKTELDVPKSTKRKVKIRQNRDLHDIFVLMCSTNPL